MKERKIAALSAEQRDPMSQLSTQQFRWHLWFAQLFNIQIYLHLFICFSPISYFERWMAAQRSGALIQIYRHSIIYGRARQNTVQPSATNHFPSQNLHIKPTTTATTNKRFTSSCSLFSDIYLWFSKSSSFTHRSHIQLPFPFRYPISIQCYVTQIHMYVNTQTTLQFPLLWFDIIPFRISFQIRMKNEGFLSPRTVPALLLFISVYFFFLRFSFSLLGGRAVVVVCKRRAL